MAGIAWRANCAQVASGTAAKTLIQVVAPTNQRLLIRSIAVSFKGTVNSNAPVLVELLRQNDAGTSSALTPVKWNSADDETLQVTAREAFTVEPAAGNVLFRDFVHPQGGALERVFADKFPIPIPGGVRFGLRLTADNDVQVVASIGGEE